MNKVRLRSSERMWMRVSGSKAAIGSILRGQICKNCNPIGATGDLGYSELTFKKLPWTTGGLCLLFRFSQCILIDPLWCSLKGDTNFLGLQRWRWRGNDCKASHEVPGTPSGDDGKTIMAAVTVRQWLKGTLRRCTRRQWQPLSGRRNNCKISMSLVTTRPRHASSRANSYSHTCYMPIRSEKIRKDNFQELALCDVFSPRGPTCWYLQRFLNIVYTCHPIPAMSTIPSPPVTFPGRIVACLPGTSDTAPFGLDEVLPHCIVKPCQT